ncbi:P-loop containing nucleoside triphosphate hydrolase protein [Paraphysoderma sedebokerense]|nr:P-loop containing nucleoside triphosphate hydrolase protein [Paraphysoderma sedebokerense]
MINPTAGRAILNGVDLIPFSEDLIGRIGICTQHDILYPNMTVYDHLRLFCHVKRIPLQTHSQQIENLLEDYNLTLMKNRNVGELSGGNRRKLTLALSCLSNPDIIFLDEPTTGIDIRARKMIWDVVLKMKKRCSIFLTSHSMDEIAYLCDRICILNEGPNSENCSYCRRGLWKISSRICV